MDVGQPVPPGSEPQPTVRATLAPAATTQVVYLPQPSSGFRRWFSWLGWMGCFLLFSVILGMVGQYQEYFGSGASGIQERYHSREKHASDKIALIEIEGVIGSVDEFVKKQIDQVREDKKVKAVVVRVNSPGGTITGSDYIYHHLVQLKTERKLPMVVSMGALAASGGYYVAMAVGDQEKSIYAEPTTTTGSIGVIIPHYDVSGLLNRFDVKEDSIATHPRKQILSMTKPMSDDHRALLQAYIGEAFGRFKEIVKSGRPKFREQSEALDTLATGEIFTATQAKNNGLVDELGFIEDAIDRAAELAGLAKDGYRVVHYKAPLSLMDALASSRAPSTQWSTHWQASLPSLLELQVPQAYYMATLQPSIISNLSSGTE